MFVIRGSAGCCWSIICKHINPHPGFVFLLKIRMQPLLDLRSTVSSLARGLMDISPRTKTNSEDEFGDLATDLTIS